MLDFIFNRFKFIYYSRRPVPEVNNISGYWEESEKTWNI